MTSALKMYWNKVWCWSVSFRSWQSTAIMPTIITIKESMYIHRPTEELSTAETILTMLRPTKEYSFQEAQTLDMALVLHMEHGGGIPDLRHVTSSGTDTYSTIAAALGSLKGPKHGGANIKVTEMMEIWSATLLILPMNRRSAAIWKQS